MCIWHQWQPTGSQKHSQLTIKESFCTIITWKCQQWMTFTIHDGVVRIFVRFPAYSNYIIFSPTRSAMVFWPSVCYNVAIYQCFCMTTAALFFFSVSILVFQLRRESTCNRINKVSLIPNTPQTGERLLSFPDPPRKAEEGLVYVFWTTLLVTWGGATHHKECHYGIFKSGIQDSDAVVYMDYYTVPLTKARDGCKVYWNTQNR